jgi:hypothetical protein
MNADDSRSDLWPDGKPMSCNWISDELLLETQELWSESYGQPIDRDKAIEILHNVKRLGEVLSNIPPVLRDGFTAPQPAEEDLPQDALALSTGSCCGRAMCSRRDARRAKGPHESPNCRV